MELHLILVCLIISFIIVLATSNISKTIVFTFDHIDISWDHSISSINPSTLSCSSVMHYYLLVHCHCRSSFDHHYPIRLFLLHFCTPDTLDRILFPLVAVCHIMVVYLPLQTS